MLEVFSDSKVSGKTLCRPGLKAAIDALQPGMVLVVDSTDRLARDMLVELTIRAQVKATDCEIEYANGTQNSTTIEGELFQNILAAFAQYERSKFSARTKAGLAKKKASGIRIGRPPIGFQVLEDGKLTEHPGEQAAIRCILNYHTKQSSENIAERITVEFGLCRGKPWSARTVRKILAKNK